ncbi:hypothetical protein [Arthrobacter sp. FW306-06-A]|uniref:hypothetical protein n=1 Tax=Arthrobacter sp. FW306-06-A TaxID=2879621 RepID=UPI001F208859|nr:hypothetical protein [Arthrobacter sp. FW306-06-A]UKA73450.1 hypothetical protein LFT49_21875 [Arthrobacter sp. FW306-06-A]
MTTNAKSLLYRRTLWAGIIVGVVGLLIMLFSNMFMQSIGTYTFNGANGFFYALTQLYVLAAQGCLPFSAGLISAALVMRYLALSSLSSEQKKADTSP